MIETVGTYAELPFTPGEVEGWLYDHSTTWRVTQDQGTGSITGTLSGEHTALGRVNIRRNLAVEHSDAAAYTMAAEGNLLTLARGNGSKHLTLRDEHVPDGVQAYRDALAEALPLAPPVQRLVRVDASVTWRRSHLDAARQLAEGTAALHAARSGRRQVARYGVEGSTLTHGKRLTDRVYDKSAETLAAAARHRGAAPDLGEGRLVRFERQMRSARARKHYGDDLTALTNQGADMARRAIRLATSTCAGQDTSGTPDHLYARLVAHGASATEAVRLMGAAQLLERGGIPALTRFGMPLPTAYRLRARLRDLYGEPVVQPDDDVMDRLDEDQALDDHVSDQHGVTQANLWDVDEAEWA